MCMCMQSAVMGYHASTATMGIMKTIVLGVQYVYTISWHALTQKHHHTRHHENNGVPGKWYV